MTVQATTRGKTLIEADLERLVEHLPHAEATLSRDAREAVARLLTLATNPSAAP